MKKHNLSYKKIWLALGIAMVVFVIVDTLLYVPIGVPKGVPDKFLHIFGYFSMMGWFVQIYHNKKHQMLLAIGFVCMGISLEFLQGWGGVRQYEVADMLANATGVLLAWVLSLTRFADILFLVESFIPGKNTTPH